jgi:hypothetical protein
VLLALAPETDEVDEPPVLVPVPVVPVTPVPVADPVVEAPLKADPLTEVYSVVLPIVLVDTSEPEETVVSTASVVYGLDVAPVELDVVLVVVPVAVSVAVPEAALYRVVLPTVLVITLDPEVKVVKTASVVYGVEVAPVAAELAPFG